MLEEKTSTSAFVKTLLKTGNRQGLISDAKGRTTQLANE